MKRKFGKKVGAPTKDSHTCLFFMQFNWIYYLTMDCKNTHEMYGYRYRDANKKFPLWAQTWIDFKMPLDQIQTISETFINHNADIKMEIW